MNANAPAGKNLINGLAMARYEPKWATPPRLIDLAQAEATAGVAMDTFEKAGEVAEGGKKLGGNLGEIGDDLRRTFKPSGPVLTSMKSLGKAAGFLSTAYDLTKGGLEILEIARDPNLTKEQRDRLIGEKTVEVAADVLVGGALVTAGAALGSIAGPFGAVAGIMIANSLKDKLGDFLHKKLEEGRNPSPYGSGYA